MSPLRKITTRCGEIDKRLRFDVSAQRQLQIAFEGKSLRIINVFSG